MRILVLSPHTDDAEIGAGASLVRLIKEGAKARILAFSTGNSETGATEDEFRAAMGVLGVTDFELLGFKARRFPSQRQEILQRLVDERNGWKPDIVLCPATFDVHQDHRVVCDEAVRAFRRSCTILGYDMPCSSMGAIRLSKFVWVDAEHVITKTNAIGCYKSQVRRQATSRRFIEALAFVRGAQIGYRFAEAFEVIREI